MSETDSDSDYYDVEKIIAKEIVGNEVRYLVKWENFPESECTWEPEENLDNVQHFIDEFNKRFSNENYKAPDKSLECFQKKKRGRPKKTCKSTQTSDDSEDDDENHENKGEKKLNTIDESELKESYIDNPENDPRYDKEIPEKIISIKKMNEDIFCFTKWKERNDGITPDDCYVKNTFFKRNYPKLLIEYYEKRVRFVNSK